MAVFDNLTSSEPLLVLSSDEDKSKYKHVIKKFESAQISTLELLKDVEPISMANVVAVVTPEKFTSEVFSNILKILKPEGKLILTNISDVNSVEFNLKTNGFMNVVTNESSVIASKPKFAVGSSAKLNLKKPAVWKLDDDGDDEDLIDPDDLLDEDDLIKPDPTSLRVCGTTGQRKACKDCSCGLADELIAEAEGEKVVTSDAPKSSCGSCYLGDAFRCATCPYLGMPAFKPGEKIQLSSTLLKSDI